MRPLSIQNKDAAVHVAHRQLFKGTNLYSLNIGYVYAVFSYTQAYPMFLYAQNQWYENSDKSTLTTERQRALARPAGVSIKLKTTLELRTMLHAAVQPASAVPKPDAQ